MSFTILGNQPSDVLQGAQITLTQLFETFPGSGEGGVASGVTVGIEAATTPGGGKGTPLTPTSAGVVARSDSLYQYVWACAATQELGDYLVTWSGTVSGQTLTYINTVTVAAVASGSPAPGVYAKVDQYRAWSRAQFTPATHVSPLLRRA